VHGRPGEQLRETDDVAEIEQLHVRQYDVLDCLHVVHLGGRTVTRRVAPHQPVTGGPDQLQITAPGSADLPISRRSDLYRGHRWQPERSPGILALLLDAEPARASRPSQATQPPRSDQTKPTLRTYVRVPGDSRVAAS
jgi:hypothetical protein